MLNDIKFYSTDYLYTPLFCEENIWQLIHSLSSSDLPVNTLWCLLITNPDKKIPLLNQRSAANNQPVIWDYHVILLALIREQPVIFDFDSRLGFVTPLDEYLKNSFIFAHEAAHHLPEEFIPYIRKIPAQSYLNNFYSDREHMRQYLSADKFPHWPLINNNKAHRTSLTDYLDISHKLPDNCSLIKVASFAAVKQLLLDG